MVKGFNPKYYIQVTTIQKKKHEDGKYREAPTVLRIICFVGTYGTCFQFVYCFRKTSIPKKTVVYLNFA
jgi:hypothetical protein